MVFLDGVEVLPSFICSSCSLAVACAFVSCSNLLTRNMSLKCLGSMRSSSNAGSAWRTCSVTLDHVVVAVRVDGADQGVSVFLRVKVEHKVDKSARSPSRSSF